MTGSFSFDYEGMAGEYGTFKKIINSGDENSVAGILTKSNKDLREYCGVEEMAIYGDLANQLLLDWDNFSSDFPSFIEKFDSWSKIVAAAGGNYDAYEQEIAKLYNEHKLGWAAPKGMEQGYVKTGYYSNAYSLDDITSMEELLQFYNLTGAKYVDTGMETYAKRHMLYNGVTDVLTVGSLVFSGVSIFAGLKGLLAAAPAATSSPAFVMYGAEGLPIYGPMVNNTCTALALPGPVKTVLGLTGVFGLTGGFMSGTSNVAAWIGSEYDPKTYMKNIDAYNNWQSIEDSNGVKYSYVSDVGTEHDTLRLYRDEKGTLYYCTGDGTDPVQVTGKNGKPANINNLGLKKFEIHAGDAVITNETQFSIVHHESDVNLRDKAAMLNGYVNVTGDASLDNTVYIDEEYTRGDLNITSDEKTEVISAEKIENNDAENSEPEPPAE